MAYCVAMFTTKFISNKEHSRTALIFCFHSKKFHLLRNHTDYLEKLMGNMLHRKKRVIDDFSVSKLEISMLQTRNMKNRSKNTKNVELQALLDEDDSQTQKQFAEQLSVSQQAVSNRLREMGKIQKVRWVN